MSDLYTRATLLAHAHKRGCGCVCKGKPDELADLATLAVSKVWETDPKGARKLAALFAAQLAQGQPIRIEIKEVRRADLH